MTPDTPYIVFVLAHRGGLGALALTICGSVGPPAMWAATSNVRWSGTAEGAQGPYLRREGSTGINYLQGSSSS